MICCAKLRLMEPKDIPSITKMLEAEGLQQEGHFHTRKNNFTFILEDEMDRIQGFFTLNFVDSYINLQHFCVAREFRTVKMAAKLIRCVRDVVKKLGYNKMIVHGKGERINKVISWYFKTKPYKTAEDGALLYLVMV